MEDLSTTHRPEASNESISIGKTVAIVVGSITGTIASFCFLRHQIIVYKRRKKLKKRAKESQHANPQRPPARLQHPFVFTPTSAESMVMSDTEMTPPALNDAGRSPLDQGRHESPEQPWVGAKRELFTS
jgi:hypothetical protein